MSAPDAVLTLRLLPVQWVTVIGVVVAMASVAVVAMVGADATLGKAMTARTTMLSRSLRLSLIHNQWLVPVQTGAVIVPGVAMAKDAALISHLQMLHRKTLRPNNSNSSSQLHASNHLRVNV